MKKLTAEDGPQPIDPDAESPEGITGREAMEKLSQVLCQIKDMCGYDVLVITALREDHDVIVAAYKTADDRLDGGAQMLTQTILRATQMTCDDDIDDWPDKVG
jgi:hypothetical protein